MEELCFRIYACSKNLPLKLLKSEYQLDLQEHWMVDGSNVNLVTGEVIL